MTGHVVTLSGASDDLIEVDGAISEEWNEYDADERHIAFSDGTLAKISYTADGTWRILVQKTGPGTTFELVQCKALYDDDYTDRLTLTADKPFVWATCSNTHPGYAPPG